MPEISKKSSEILSRSEPDLAPVITQIMNAVFCEEELGWDKERKIGTCSIKIYNYTARARAYTILVKWPENDTISMVDNERTCTIIEFGVNGLAKGEWTDTDVFFRGNGDIIGASKIDEALLNEIRKTEALDAAEKEILNEIGNLEQLIDRAEINEVEELQTMQPPSNIGQLSLSEWEAE